MKTIVAVVGQNENNILRTVSRDFMALLAPFGLVGRIVDMCEPNWQDRYREIHQQGVLFAWGCAGIGSDWTGDGHCLWDRLETPFISVLADSPCLKPPAHHINSSYVVNGYQFADWLDIQKRFIRSPQVSTMLPLGVLPNAQRDATAWKDRPNRMVFVKTGEDPQEWFDRWAVYPNRLRAILHDATIEAVRVGPANVVDVLISAAMAHNLHMEHRPDLLLGLLLELDGSVRSIRAARMAQAMLHLPVDIIGRGWNYLDRSAAKARFHDAVGAETLSTLYAETQFLFNTTPNFSDRTHERVLNGFASGCCVISDQNQFMSRHFANLPSFFGVDVNDPALPDRLSALWNDPTDFGDAMGPAAALVDYEFGAMAVMRAMLELAVEVRTYPAFAKFSPTAPRGPGLSPAEFVGAAADARQIGSANEPRRELADTLP